MLLLVFVGFLCRLLNFKSAFHQKMSRDSVACTNTTKPTKLIKGI